MLKGLLALVAKRLTLSYSSRYEHGRLIVGVILVSVAFFWGATPALFQHICWDGCMFPNGTLEKPETWNAILKAMIDVREAHGWE